MDNAMNIFFSASNEARLILLLGLTLIAAAGMILYSGINLLRHYSRERGMQPTREFYIS
jgi:hypothetical protein